MDINRNNYEIYFLDYYENSLSKEQAEELMSFLESNPDLKSEFAEFEIIKIKEDSGITFPFKQNLKKKAPQINPDNYQDYMIDFIENNLTPELIEELNSFIKNNSALQKEFEAFKKTKLVADLSMTFPNKNKLKHNIFKPVVINTSYTIFNSNYIRYAIGVAASIAILTGLFMLLRNNNNQNNLANNKAKINAKHIPQIPTIQKQIPKHTEALAVVGHKSVKKNKIVVQTSKSNDIVAINEPVLNMIKPITISSVYIDNSENMIPEKSDIKQQESIDNFYANNEAEQNQTNEENVQIHNEKLTIENTIVSGALAVVGEKSLPTADPKIKRQKITSFWDLAYLATKAYDKVFDKDVSLKENFDNNGNLSSVNFNSDLVGFEKNIK